MKLIRKKSKYYYNEYLKLNNIRVEMLREGLPNDSKLNECCWRMLEKYLDCLLKEAFK